MYEIGSGKPAQIPSTHRELELEVGGHGSGGAEIQDRIKDTADRQACWRAQSSITSSSIQTPLETIWLLWTRVIPHRTNMMCNTLTHDAPPGKACKKKWSPFSSCHVILIPHWSSFLAIILPRLTAKPSRGNAPSGLPPSLPGLVS